MTFEEGGRRACLKITVILVNIPIVIFGIVAAALGIWIVLDDPSFMHFTHLDEIELFNTSYVKTGAYVIIAGGFGVALFGILGIAAASTESLVLLALYTMLIALIMAVEVAGTVLGIIFKHTVENSMEKAIGRSIKEEYDGLTDTENTFTIHFDAVQQKLQCCGFNGSVDYDSSRAWNKTTADNSVMKVPPGCCKNITESDDCVINPTADNSYTEGCKAALEDLFEKYFTVIIGVAATLVFCQYCLIQLGSKNGHCYTHHGHGQHENHQQCLGSHHPGDHCFCLDETCVSTMEGNFGYKTDVPSSTDMMMGSTASSSDMMMGSTEATTAATAPTTTISIQILKCFQDSCIAPLKVCKINFDKGVAASGACEPAGSNLPDCGPSITSGDCQCKTTACMDTL